MGRFSDRLVAPVPKPLGAVRAWYQTKAGRQRADAGDIPVTDGPLPAVGIDEVSITWIGQSSVLVRCHGLAILTDPVWSTKIPGVPRRLVPPGISWDQLPPIDAVVISHDHFDHLDEPTILRLPTSTYCVVPLGLARWFSSRGFTHVTELDWWSSIALGPLTIEFTPVQHWSKRSVFRSCESLWGGWMLSTAHGAKIFFAGDTGYGPFLTDIADRHPTVDLAMMPIGNYTPRWYHGHWHMAPEEAVAAALQLNVQRLVPIHWGTFVLIGEPPLEPRDRIWRAWHQAGLPPDRLWDLDIGETRAYSAADN